MSRKSFRKLLDQNLEKAGFVKQPYAEFDNYFLDSLISQNNNLYRDLRRTANLSRDEMAELTGVSEGSIRRYESHWQSSKPPKWYYILLRLVNGDLSFFGDKWKGSVIQHHDRKLRSFYSIRTMEPKEMFAQYNRHAIDARKEANQERQKTNELQNKVKAYEEELAILRLHNEALNQQIKELQAVKVLKKTGKVIPLFAKS